MATAAIAHSAESGKCPLIDFPGAGKENNDSTKIPGMFGRTTKVENTVWKSLCKAEHNRKIHPHNWVQLRALIRFCPNRKEMLKAVQTKASLGRNYFVP